MRVRSPLFSQGFFRHLVLQQGIGQQPLEPAVLGFQLLEALGVGDAHATEFVAPEVVAGLREAVAATQIRHRQTRLRFPQKANDLLFRKSLLHVQSPVTWDWTPESVATQIRGDVVNSTSHGLTSNRALPDEIQMIDDFVKELTAYYKPQSPLEVLQIQRIAFCRAKLAKLIDIEVAGRELYRREIESHPELVFDKLTQYSDTLKHMAVMELRGESVFKSLHLDKGTLQAIAKEIREFVGTIEAVSDLPKAFPKLCVFLEKYKFGPDISEDLDIDGRLMVFAEMVRINFVGLNESNKKIKPGSYEAAILEMDRKDRLVKKLKMKHDRYSQNGLEVYLHSVQIDLNVITDLATNVAHLKTFLQSYEEMKSWMLRSIDLNAQESERMMRYQTSLEKRLSTAIGELLELQKMTQKSSF